MTTTSELNAYLTKLYAARDATLLSQSYTVNGRGKANVDYDKIIKEIARVEAKIFKRSNKTSARVVFDRGGRN